MRVVLDTSIFISAFISKTSYPYRAVELWLEKRYELVTSVWQIEEIRTVSRYERIQRVTTPHEIGKLINGLRQRAIVYEDLPNVEYSPDPDDNPIIAAAIAGKASYIVSGDKGDLLALGRVRGISIITARRFVELSVDEWQGG